MLVPHIVTMYCQNVTSSMYQSFKGLSNTLTTDIYQDPKLSEKKSYKYILMLSQAGLSFHNLLQRDLQVDRPVLLSSLEGSIQYIEYIIYYISQSIIYVEYIISHSSS